MSGSIRSPISSSSQGPIALTAPSCSSTLRAGSQRGEQVRRGGRAAPSCISGRPGTSRRPAPAADSATSSGPTQGQAEQQRQQQHHHREQAGQRHRCGTQPGQAGHHPAQAVAREGRAQLILLGFRRAPLQPRIQCHGLATRSRSTRSKSVGVVRLEHRGLARQVEVPQPRGPEAQRAGAHHRRQQAQLVGAQGAFGVVGGDHGAGAVLVEAAGGQVDAPVVQAHRQIEQPGVERRRSRSRRSR